MLALVFSILLVLAAAACAGTSHALHPKLLCQAKKIRSRVHIEAWTESPMPRPPCIRLPAPTPRLLLSSSCSD